MTGSEIAIIGLACRVPGARNIDKFWRNLRDGVESISFFSDEELVSSGIAPEVLSDPNYVKARGILEDIELFDASFFGYSPREAEMMDPQQRLFLEEAWKAVEHAGYNPETYQGLIGVYVGAGMNTYLLNNLSPNFDHLETAASYQVMIGNNRDFIPTRVSYKLNLKGPGINVQTACSTSLTAVHLACQSLLEGECDIALAGGVSVHVPQKSGYLFQEGMILSPDGHCRAFDAKAHGTVSGNGVGVVVLKRLETAVANGDCVHAVIKGSAINNDGSLKVGFTAPSPTGQQRVIVEAQAVAEVELETITYIETHGTGTVLGDPIEIEALTRAFRSGTDRKGFCAIGSVKTNVGHLDAAAGVAGLIKTVLALKHKLLPPSLHFEHPNPKIDFANSPFYVNATLSEWRTNGIPRRAGVSSFGIGGTNVHVILEEFKTGDWKLETGNWKLKTRNSRCEQLLVISAKTESALKAATINLAEHLRQHPEINLANAAYTLQVGRKGFEHRRMLVCRTVDEAVNQLTIDNYQLSIVNAQENRRVVFMFPGQGSQYVNMARGLYENELTFREQVDRCSKILKPLMGIDLRHVLLYPGSAGVSPTSGSTDILSANKDAGETPALPGGLPKLTQTAITQPALFVIEYALAKLWMEWGVHPQAMIGHSVGEYAVACLAGVLSLEDALILITTRARLMQQLPAGTMLTVPLSETEVQPLLGQYLSLAAVNGPSLCVVSGPIEAVEALQNRLAEEGVACIRLHTSHAFHSAMMDPILEPFIEQVKKIRLPPPQIPWVSTVTGDWIRPEDATDPNYWVRNLRETVRFAHGVQQLLQDSANVLLEVGPGRTLSTLVKRCISDQQSLISNLQFPIFNLQSSLRHPQAPQSDTAFLLNTLGKLWLAGVEVDWSGFHAHEQRHRLPLPTYPFERQCYWIETGNWKLETQNSKLETGNSKFETGFSDPKFPVSSFQFPVSKKPDIADWFYVPSWKRCVGSEAHKEVECCSWLVFLDECGLGSRLVQRLEQVGQDVITVKAASGFTKLSDREYTINPRQPQDYDTLFDDLCARGRFPNMIVHLWSVTENGYPESGFETAQDRGLYSLLFLAQALGKRELHTDRKKHGQEELQGFCISKNKKMSVFPSIRRGKFSSPSVRIAVVSNGIHDVTGEELLCPEKATVLGPVKIIPQEYPHINCRNIDIVLPGSAGETPALPGNIPEKLIEQLLTELTVGSEARNKVECRSSIIAYRGRHRWIQTFEPVRLETGNSHLVPRLREEGVYLITGGLGGIGLTLAEYLAKAVRAKLILTGRSAFPAREEWEPWLNTRKKHDVVSSKILKLQEIEALQAEVLTFSADVADQEQMERVIAQAEEQFGPINGVIHAAGIPGGGIIQRRTREEIENILAPKVRGTLILGTILKDIQLDFFVLCSSLTSILGKFGQVSYCAANAFLDAFAHRGTFEDNKFTVSINWDAWQLGEEKKRRAITETSLAEFAITPEEGMKAFQCILSWGEVNQIVVSTEDLQTRFDQWIKFKPSQRQDKFEKKESVSLHSRPNLPNSYVAPRNQFEQTLIEIWQQLLGIERIGIHDDFFELGGDSLMITLVISRINKVFGVDLPPRSLFEKPTVAALADHIETIHWAVQDQQTSTNYKQEEGEI